MSIDINDEKDCKEIYVVSALSALVTAPPDITNDGYFWDEEFPLIYDPKENVITFDPSYIDSYSQRVQLHGIAAMNGVQLHEIDSVDDPEEEICTCGDCPQLSTETAH